jgi:hypothetical protein
MAVQNPPVKGGFELPVMSFSGVVLVALLLVGPFRLLCTGCYVKRISFALLFI